MVTPHVSISRPLYEAMDFSPARFQNEHAPRAWLTLERRKNESSKSVLGSGVDIKSTDETIKSAVQDMANSQHRVGVFLALSSHRTCPKFVRAGIVSANDAPRSCLLKVKLNESFFHRTAIEPRSVKSKSISSIDSPIRRQLDFKLSQPRIT